MTWSAIATVTQHRQQNEVCTTSHFFQCHGPWDRRPNFSTPSATFSNTRCVPVKRLTPGRRRDRQTGSVATPSMMAAFLPRPQQPPPYLGNPRYHISRDAISKAGPLEIRLCSLTRGVQGMMQPQTIWRLRCLSSSPIPAANTPCSPLEATGQRG
jgi:hypothetical protein